MSRTGPATIGVTRSTHRRSSASWAGVRVSPGRPGWRGPSNGTRIIPPGWNGRVAGKAGSLTPKLGLARLRSLCYIRTELARLKEEIMHIRWNLTLILALLWTGPVAAQGFQLRWQKGTSFSYKIKHHTTVTEVVEGKKSEASGKLDLVKRWHVADVNDKGVARLEMSITAMRNEQQRPNGEIL